MAPTPGAGCVGAGGVAPPSSTHAVEGDIIDVDALPPVAVAPSAGDNRSTANVNCHPERPADEQPIDVDDPDTLARLSTASTGGPSDGGRRVSARKFDGLLGEVLYEQKIEVKNEEAGAVLPSVATGGGAQASHAGGVAASAASKAPSSGVTTVGNAAAAARVEVEAEMTAANNVREAVVAAISQDRSQQLQLSWPPSVPRVVASSSPRPGDGGPSEASVAPVLDSLADLSGSSRTMHHGPMVHTVPHTMSMPPAQQTLVPPNPSRSRLPRRPRRGFVRRAAVMCAPPYVPRMYADPPTPPPEGPPGAAGSPDGGDSRGEVVADGDEESNDYIDIEGAPFDDAVEAVGASGDIRSGVDEVAHAVGRSGASLMAEVGGTGVPGSTLQQGAVVMQGRSYPQFSGGFVQPSTSALQNAVPTAAIAGAVLQAGGTVVPSGHAGVDSNRTGLVSGASVGPVAPSDNAGTGGDSSLPSNPRKRALPDGGADEGSPSGAPVADGPRTAADVLAGILAARSRNPTIFPAACWVPGAQAVFTAAQAGRVQAGQAESVRVGLPPTASVAPRRPGTAGVNMASSPRRASVGTPQPPSPIMPPIPMSSARVPPPSLHGDESSDDMNDDDLVLAYVTPPASPSLAARGSPRSARPSSGKRRRLSVSRAVGSDTAAEASGAGAAPVNGADGESETLASREVYNAVRAGFSSLRRELTRYRQELVVVKSQSASVLRRMDGLSAAADGSASGNGAMMERVAGLEKAISALVERLPVAGGGSAERGTSDEMSVSLITDIKVRFPGVSHSTRASVIHGGGGLCVSVWGTAFGFLRRPQAARRRTLTMCCIAVVCD